MLRKYFIYWENKKYTSLQISMELNISTQHFWDQPVIFGFHWPVFEKERCKYYGLQLFNGLLHQNVIYFAAFFFPNDSVARFHSTWATVP
jgi:hypothetical protein